MEMRSGRPAGCADPADQIALPERLALTYQRLGEMEERAGQPHSVREDDQIAFDADGGRPGEHDDPVGGRHHGGAGAGRDVYTVMERSRLAAIDALRSEDPAD